MVWAFQHPKNLYTSEKSNFMIAYEQLIQEGAKFPSLASLQLFKDFKPTQQQLEEQQQIQQHWQQSASQKQKAPSSQSQPKSQLKSKPNASAASYKDSWKNIKQGINSSLELVQSLINQGEKNLDVATLGECKQQLDQYAKELEALVQEMCNAPSLSEENEQLTDQLIGEQEALL